MTIQNDTEAKVDTETPDRSLFIAGGRVGILLIHGLGGTPVELRRPRSRLVPLVFAAHASHGRADRRVTA